MLISEKPPLDNCLLNKLKLRISKIYQQLTISNRWEGLIVRINGSDTFGVKE